jgi:glycine/D-amino acid oxidase-like deaminating enzyme
MYDVIIVGARVAGASTAMLLARRGLKVLVVDRATFPSDTLSTHQVQLPGVARAWASGSGPAAGRSGSAAPPTCPATCASPTVPAGPWSVTPACS